MITQKELDAKYPDGTPYWRKDAIEWYTCTKHDQPTVLIRDANVVVHGNSESECA